jgi:hypothetical protein
MHCSQAFGLSHYLKDQIMASSKLLAGLLLFLPILAQAQGACGIFASRKDFVNNDVSYKIDDCSMKVRMNKSIVGYHNGVKLKFDFRFIFGYYDGENLYRAYGLKNLWTDHGYYKVIYDQDLVIYQRTLVNYRADSQTHYYFSLTKDSPIMPLRKRFYTQEVPENIRVDFSALKRSIILPTDAEQSDWVTAKSTGQKKKPDISARLQTTTRRPKIFKSQS